MAENKVQGYEETPAHRLSLIQIMLELSDHQLAQELGCTQTMIYYIKKSSDGTGKLLHLLIPLYEKYKISPNYLLLGIGDKFIK